VLWCGANLKAPNTRSAPANPSIPHSDSVGVAAAGWAKVIACKLVATSASVLLIVKLVNVPVRRSIPAEKFDT
jgi:hypothetical protein